jgi:effector-binding domain-containing protein
MDYAIAVEQRAEQATAMVSGHVAHDAIPEFLGGAYAELMSVLSESDIIGPPFARYDIDGDGFSIEAGFPVAQRIAPIGRVVPGRLHAGTVATTMHVGSYTGLGAAYSALETWLEETGHMRAGRPWECYLDGPEVAEPRTLVCWPVAAL